MKLFISLMWLLCSLFSVKAHAQDSGSDAYYKAMLQYCLPPIVAGMDVAKFEEKQKLQEFPADKAALFDKNGGRVFAVPEAMGNAVLVARTVPGPSCSLAIRQADAKDFWAKLDTYFGPSTPFKMVKDEVKPDGAVEKAFQAEFNGKTGLIIAMRDQPKEQGMQGLMTFFRFK